MKKVLLSVAVISLLSADNLYTVNKKDAKVPVVNLNNSLILKSTTSSKLESTDVFENNWLVKGQNQLKIYNISSQDLLTDKTIKNSYKAKYTSDGSKIIVLNSSKNIVVYNTKTLKKIGEYAGEYKDFAVRNNLLLIIGYPKSKLIDLNTGVKIADLKNDKIGEISPNSKKIALAYYKKIYIYNLKGVLLNTIDLNKAYAIFEIQWLDNKNIGVLAEYYHGSYDKKRVEIYNVITSQLKSSTDSYYYKNLDYFKVVTSNELLLADNNLAWIYNLSTQKIEKKFNLSENTNIDSIVLKDGYLSVAYNDNNAYLYKVDKDLSLPTNIAIQSKITKQTPTPKVITKTVTKVVTKVVEKKVYVKQKTNIKPTLEFFASTSSGYAPLTVKFKILANDEDGKIVSYYMNFAGKEILKKGNPTKTFSYTFDNAGNYNIMVAVKDNNGAITTKKLTIKVKEESFNDFKKNMMGN